MNECEKIHPLLPDYIREKLPMTERRWVARHLNHCAEARRILDEIKGGTRRKPAEEPRARLSWDERMLRWFGGASPKKPLSPAAARRGLAAPTSSAEKKRLGIIETVFMVVLVFPFWLVAVLIPNRYWSPVLQIPLVQREVTGFKALKAQVETEWFHQPPPVPGWDPQSAPHWEGTAGPAAQEQQILVSDEDSWAAYWQLVAPGVPEPAVDFTQADIVVLFQGQRPTTGFALSLRKITNEGGTTVYDYQERRPGYFSFVKKQVTSPWAAAVVPKPAATVVFKKN